MSFKKRIYSTKSTIFAVQNCSKPKVPAGLTPVPEVTGKKRLSLATYSMWQGTTTNSMLKQSILS